MIGEQKDLVSFIVEVSGFKLSLLLRLLLKASLEGWKTKARERIYKLFYEYTFILTVVVFIYFHSTVSLYITK